MPWINCEINLILTWSASCVICKADRATTFVTTDTNKTLCSSGNFVNSRYWKFATTIKIRIKTQINSNKYQSKLSTQTQNQKLDYLIDLSFHRKNRLFALSFEDNAVRTGHTRYVLPKVEIKDNNFTNDGRNYFDQRFRNNIKTYENIRKIATWVEDDYTTGSLLDYPYLKENYKLIAIDSSKQQTRDANRKAIQHINL